MEQLDYRLVKFVQLLRVLGLRISVAETLDAISGLGMVDLMNRSQVEAVLRATLLKNMDQLPVFQEAFNSYFITPEKQAIKQAERQAAVEIEVQEMAQAEAELSFQGETLDLTPEQKQLYNRLPEEGKQRIQDFLQRSSDGHRYGDKLDVNFKPIVENMVRGHLDYWKRQLSEELPLFNAMPTDDPELDDMVQEVEDSLREHQANYLYEDLKNIADQDLAKVGVLIRRLSRRLASRISRRYRQSPRMDRLDLRRTIRSSLSYGGALVELKYKSRPRTKPRFLLLCDVSGSMARYASFVLQFIYGLSSVLKGIESFVFAEGLEKVTNDFVQGEEFAAVMARVMNKSQEWGGGTNLAQALERLNEEFGSLLTKDTVIIVLSDTKTLEAKRAAQLMHEIRRRTKQIVWLNTLPQKQWPQFRSIKEFSCVCQMFECYTLAHLEKIMSSQLI